MRYAFAAIAASLLAKDTVLAASLHGHRVYHNLNERDVTVTDEVVEVATVYMTVTVDWPGNAATSAAPTTSIPAAVAPAAVTPAVVVPAVVAPVVVAPIVSPTPASVAPSKAAVSSAPIVQAAAFVDSKPATTLQTVAKAAAATKAPAGVATSAPAGSSGAVGKKGLCYNSASLLSPFTSKAAWAYNWDSSSAGLASGFEFVPLLWGTASHFTSVWSANAKKAIASGSTHLMSFNEPDLSEQANIGYADAAAAYKTFMMPFAGSAKLGAPAVTNGAAPMGLAYLSNFKSACSGCQIDFCSIHWYDSASNIDYFKSYMKQAADACGGPIWVTEFGASGSDSQIATFLATVIPWMNSQSYIERYSYFMASSGSGMLLSGNSLSTIGSAYVSA